MPHKTQCSVHLHVNGPEQYFRSEGIFQKKRTYLFQTGSLSFFFIKSDIIYRLFALGKLTKARLGFFREFPLRLWS